MSLRRDNMVFGQFLPNKLTDKNIIQAFRSASYEKFLPDYLKKIAYCDTPLKLEHQSGDRYALPALTLMRLLRAAKINRHERVLLVGDPTGYSAIVLSYIAQQVTLVEQSPVWFSELSKSVYDTSPHNMTVFNGPYISGVKPQAPFDCIIVTGVLDAPLDQLLRQLKPKGRLLAFDPLRQETNVGVCISRASSIQQIERSQTKLPLFEAVVPCLSQGQNSREQQEFYL